MKFIYIRTDDWGRPVYKDENEDLWKDITCGSDNPQLYDCDNDFDGEPGWPCEYNNIVFE